MTDYIGLLPTPRQGCNAMLCIDRVRPCVFVPVLRGYTGPAPRPAPTVSINKKSLLRRCAQSVAATLAFLPSRLEEPLSLGYTGTFHWR